MSSIYKDLNSILDAAYDYALDYVGHNAAPYVPLSVLSRRFNRAVSRHTKRPMLQVLRSDPRFLIDMHGAAYRVAVVTPEKLKMIQMVESMFAEDPE